MTLPAFQEVFSTRARTAILKNYRSPPELDCTVWWHKLRRNISSIFLIITYFHNGDQYFLYMYNLLLQHHLSKILGIFQPYIIHYNKQYY